MIELQNLSLLRGSKVLLESANLTVHPGQKWGFIGANGSGKSSLFKLLLGELHEDSGSCKLPKNWQLAHMAQEVGACERLAIDYVIDGDAELRKLETRISSLENESNKSDGGEALAKLYSDMENIDGYTAPSRAQRLLYGLGFKSGDGSRSVNDFSGGWRIRLNLAQALMCRSDLLLLDEPTNHLDLDATVWLEQWLQNYKGTLLVISHDRDFLDNVISNIISVENKQLHHYSGNYSFYEKQRAENLAQQQASFEKQQSRIAEIENFVRRFRAKATKAKQAQSRLKELERMEKIAPAHVDSPFSFRFPSAEKNPQTLITLSDVSIGYGKSTVVSDIELNILASTRIGLLGHNGAGKSTLIKTLAGTQEVLSGERTEGAHLQIGYFAQHQLEALDLSASSALHLQRLSPKAPEQQIRNFLGSFGFHGDRAFEEISHFSGGEKARLALAIVAWEKPNLLILDEPTNHLDLEMRHALTLALQEFEGAIITVSHDRHLLNNTVDSFLLVDEGKITEFDGDLNDYQSWLAKRSREQNKGEETKKLAETRSAVIEKKADRKEQRQQAAAIREKLKPFRKEMNALEKQMEIIQVRLDKLEKLLSDPSVYENNDDLPLLLKEQGELKIQLASLEEGWLEKSEEMEALQAQLSM